jgi:molybdopterin-containing oxidoreductase family iron-sulfur binding subunit/tetrathionate reductase subunit B
MVGCKMENGLPEGQFWIRVLNPENRVIQDRPVGKFPDLSMAWLPLPCQQCTAPPCIEACPTGALYKREADGIVLVEKEACDGCQVCMSACPYDALSFNEVCGSVEKCTLCVHRIDRGKAPFCYEVCIGRAIHFGNLNDLNSDVGLLLASNEYHVLKEDDKTGPSVYYLNFPRGVFSIR